VGVLVRVSGQSGAGVPFEEETHTRAISAHGALIPVWTQVYRGQRVTLSNVQTKAALESVLSDTLKGIKAIILKWEWSSRCPIQCSGMWPFR
jgi:hypothetical protein